MKDMPEFSGVGVASGQLSSCMCRVLHLQHNTTFSFWILPWKEIFLGSIIGSSPVGKISTCFLPFLIFLLNSYLHLNTDTTTPKLEKAGLPISEKTNFFPKIQTYFWHISESPKQHWISVPASFSFVVFDPKTRFQNAKNIRFQNLFRAYSEHIMRPSSDISLIRAE